MPTPVLATTLMPIKDPKVVFFVFKPGQPQVQKNLEEISGRVVQLQIEAAGKDPNGVHLLRRLDTAGQLVWVTEHPSLKETLWHAEFEYGIAESAWKKAST